MKDLKIGLLLDRPISDKYIYEFTLWAKNQGNISISHLLVLPLRPESKRERITRNVFRQASYGPISELPFRLIIRVENWLLKWTRMHIDHYQLFDLRKTVSGIVEIEPIGSESGHGYQFSNEDVEKVKALDLDLLIRYGSGILRGSILEASRLGVISLHYGDNRVKRGGPPGFWECYYRWSQTGFTIQRLREENDSADVLVRGTYGTRYFYSLNQAHVCTKALTHFKNFLEKVASTGRLPPAESGPIPYSNKIFRHPSFAQCLVYGCKLLTRISVRAITRILRIRERFGISLLSGKWREAEFARSTEAELPKGRFWADPFLCTRGGKTFCFVEDLVYKTNKGHITALEVNGTKIVERGIALQEPFHLSFPFLFEYLGELYMCPECCESRQIRIFRCTEFPLKWEFEKTLMDNVSAVDTMLFEKEGKWWMLTNIDESGTNDYGSELYLFSSDSPLGTTWTPHQKNPIRIDSIGGRNAGLIIDGDKMYRLSQCQGFDQYGESLLVNEVKQVSESHYAEEPVARINPNFRKGLLGTHHLSTDGKTTVIDHVSYSLVI